MSWKPGTERRRARQSGPLPAPLSPMQLVNYASQGIADIPSQYIRIHKTRNICVGIDHQILVVVFSTLQTGLLRRFRARESSSNSPSSESHARN